MFTVRLPKAAYNKFKPPFCSIGETPRFPALPFTRPLPFVALATIGDTGRSTGLGINTGGDENALKLRKYIDKQVEFVRDLNESSNVVRPYLRSGSIERWDALDSGLQAPIQGASLLHPVRHLPQNAW